MTEIERLRAENDEWARRYAWQSASNEKLLELMRDLISDNRGTRQLAAGRALALLNALQLT